MKQRTLPALNDGGSPNPNTLIYTVVHNYMIRKKIKGRSFIRNNGLDRPLRAVVIVMRRTIPLA